MKNQNFNYGQIKWAASHDWFAFAPVDGSAIYAWDCYGDGTTKIAKLTNFKNLRDWAGY